MRGAVAVTQRNALQSWRAVHPDVQVCLCGDDEGVGALAAECGVDHVADVACNSYGTPLLDSVFRLVAARARHDVFCYTNADILLASDLVAAVQAIPFRRFLTVSKRRDVTVAGRLDFSDDRWRRTVETPESDDWQTRTQTGLDVFVFPRDPVFLEIPPFAVGRPAWDQWYVYHAWRHRVPIVDVTGQVTILHQGHDYGHVPDGTGRSWNGPEGDENRALAGRWETTFTVLDATHSLTNGRVKPARQRAQIERRVERLRIFHPRLFKSLPSWKLRYSICALFTRI